MTHLFIKDHNGVDIDWLKLIQSQVSCMIGLVHFLTWLMLPSIFLMFATPLLGFSCKTMIIESLHYMFYFHTNQSIDTREYLVNII